MRSRLTLGLVAVALTATAVPSIAAAKPKLAPAKAVSWVDPAGDANGLNDQGGVAAGAPANGPALGPLNLASADILGVKISRVDDKKTVQGIAVSLTLAAPPAQGTLYRLTGLAGDCTTFWFQYNWVAGGTPTSTLRHNCAPSGSPTAAVSDTVSIPIPAAVSGNVLTWTLPLKLMPAGIKIGTRMEPEYAETRLIIGVGPQGLVTAPTIDETETQTISYRIGS